MESIKINTAQARKVIAEKGYGRVSLPTVINWCRKYRLGAKIGGRWWLDGDKLNNFLNKGAIDGTPPPPPRT